ncbi:MAG TPA: hypothetical protein VFK31_07685 [Rhodanobacteraceae bacterium]|nr:hypothetical protein [Rhodanobacteraceae bacterium]
MFELFVVLAVAGGLWLALMVAWFVFKLLFGLIGGFFSVLGALLFLGVGGLVMLAVLPVMVFALFPLWLPLLALGVIVWLVLRDPRKPAPAEASRSRW